MASTGEEENVLQENSGRRTRSSRRVSGTQPVASSLGRSTRRSKKQEQLTEQEELIQESTTAEQSDIIQEMLAEAAQGNLVDSGEVLQNASPQHQVEQEIVQEIVEEDIVEEIISTEGDECVVFEEQVIEEIYENAIEENHENIAVNSDANLDEKSSSFPFATEEVGQSETSEDLNEQRDGKEENNETENQGAQENSLLASLVGDNANSLPSVGCGAESEKEHFESKVLEENCEKLDSEDSLSEPAVAEELPNVSGSDDTMVNTEVISEDELPPPTKPEINDAEEVSDEELPAPQRAELPADAEVISEDELPVTTAVTDDQKNSAAGKKRKAELPPDAEVISEDELPISTTVGEKQSSRLELTETTAVKKRKAEVPPDAEVISEDELPNTAGEKDSPSPAKSEEQIDSSSRKKRKAESRASSTEKKIEGDSSKKDEQYNPMSPTSESNDSTPAEKKPKIEEFDQKDKEKRKDKEREKEKDGSINSSGKDKEREKDKDKEKERKKLPDLDKYWRAVKDDPVDFTGWTYLLQYVDNESDAEAAREAYDAFLSHYPYCYGYWRKYADYEKRKGIKANCNAVFERGLEAIPLSVDLWIHYLTHVKSNHSDDEDYIRSQFERAVESCGLEFRSDKLWDAYLKWENEGKRYQNMVKIYDRLIAIPTQGYSGHFDNFQDLINQHSITSTIAPEEIRKIRIELRESAASSSKSSSSSRSKSKRSSSKDKDTETKDKEKEKEKEKEKDSESDKEKTDKVSNEEVTEKVHTESNAEAVVIDATPGEEIKSQKSSDDLGDLTTLTEDEIHSIKDKVISLRRKIHKTTVSAITARWTFEEGIKRPYFHVKPLERCQLKNWKDYLDFEIEKGDRKRILVLFERCLIACALYDEFWLKMIRYLETIIDQPGVPAITSDVYRRACEIHHPDKPSLHLMWAAFEECQNNFDRAAEILVNLEKKVPNLLQVAYRRINVERRRGDYEKCKSLYEHYINAAKNKNIAGSLAIKYARFLNKICQDLEGGLKILRQALDKDSANTRVALQMIDLALQRPTVDEDEVVLIMDKFMARENIEPEQKVLFAQRKVEFLEDFGGSAKGLQDAQRALQLALNKVNEAKKKRENSPSRKSGHKDASSISSATQSAYNNGSSSGTASYNYGSGNSSAYYAQQNSGGSYPQQQQSYDSYYNHWQYNTGYSGYGQWSGYTNYY